MHSVADGGVGKTDIEAAQPAKNVEITDLDAPFLGFASRCGGRERRASDRAVSITYIRSLLGGPA